MTTYDLSGTGTVHEVDPISRIEGHLGVAVKVDNGFVVDANAHGNLWRGFENFLLGRKPNDAITFTQRICGVCPVPHGMTATYAADAVLGYSAGHITFKGVVSEKAMLIRNLVLASEFLMSSITHFYHLVAPSFVQGPGIPPWTPYFNDNYYSPLLRESAAGPGATKVGGKTVVPDADTATMQLWDAVIISYVKALKMRRLTFEAGALFAGRMPMTSCYVAGGVTNDTSDGADFNARCAKFKELIRTVGLWIVQEYVPIAFALGLLYVDYDNAGNTGINAIDTTLHAGKGYGAGLGRFLAWGAFPEVDNSLFVKGGVKGPDVPNFTVANKTEVLAKWLNPLNANCSVEKNLTEDIAHSRYAKSTADAAAYGSGTTAYPGAVKRTKPDRTKGYSYMKTPLWKGKQCEVGPLARLAVAGIYPTDGSSSLSGVYAPIYALNGSLNPHALSPELKAGLQNTNTHAVVPNTTAAQLVADWLLPGGAINVSGVVGGLSTMDRIRARALESLLLVQRMVGDVHVDDDGDLSWLDNWNTQNDTVTGTPCWIDQLSARGGQDSWSAGQSAARTVGTWHGYGATEAPRGALMHQVTIMNNKIVAYQCVVPTTWNGAPKSGTNENGPIEKAVIGAPWDDHPASFPSQGSGSVPSKGGIEVVRIAQSFDPCIACAVH